MRSTEGLFSSLHHFRVYPLRTCLSLFGILVGSASLVAMVGIGEGTRIKIISDMERLGGTGLVAVQNDPARARMAGGREAEQRLTWEDYRSILEESGVVALSAPVALSPVRFLAGDRETDAPCLGVTPGFFLMRQWAIASGRILHDIDVRNASRVCVLGSQLRERLFPGGGDPVGKDIRLGEDHEFRVVGVMEEYQVEGASWMNAQALVPITTLQKVVSGDEHLESIMLRARRTSDVPLLAAAVERVLQRRHGDASFFNIYSQTRVINAVQGSTRLLRFSFGAIAAIVLLVGGIGIMNLMLVSVIDRTREIGIRKAVGAAPADIFLQFVLEAVILTSLGGAAGIALGMGAGDLFSLLVARYLGDYVVSVVTWQTLLLAMASIAVVGLVFGLYPAARAARLDPSRSVGYE